MENRDIISAGIVGGLISAITFTIPFVNFINCFCCMGIMSGGAVALIYYDRNQPEKLAVSNANAITLGLSSGLIGAFIALFSEWLIYQLFGDWQLDVMKQAMWNMEEVPQLLDDLLAEAEQQAAIGFNGFAIILRNLILFPLFCVFGALITRLFVNRKR